MYFRTIRALLDEQHADLGFLGRDRTRTDAVNVLVNYCSALLRETVTSAILAAGLDPFVSFLHTPARGRPTLAFDLMEEWRPVLLESTVLALVNLRAVTPDDLTSEGGLSSLSGPARKHAIRRFHARLSASARAWPPLPDRRTYLSQIHSQARLLRRWLLDEETHYQTFAWR